MKNAQISQGVGTTVAQATLGCLHFWPSMASLSLSLRGLCPDGHVQFQGSFTSCLPGPCPPAQCGFSISKCRGIAAFPAATWSTPALCGRTPWGATSDHGRSVARSVFAMTKRVWKHMHGCISLFVFTYYINTYIYIYSDVTMLLSQRLRGSSLAAVFLILAISLVSWTPGEGDGERDMFFPCAVASPQAARRSKGGSGHTRPTLGSQMMPTVWNCQSQQCGKPM